MDVRFRWKSGRAADITGTTELDPKRMFKVIGDERKSAPSAAILPKHSRSKTLKLGLYADYLSVKRRTT
jgi:hypothetical protein